MFSKVTPNRSVYFIRTVQRICDTRYDLNFKSTLKISDFILNIFRKGSCLGIDSSKYILRVSPSMEQCAQVI